MIDAFRCPYCDLIVDCDGDDIHYVSMRDGKASVRCSWGEHTFEEVDFDEAETYEVV